jgi:NAD(P)H-dependent FMN reductase
LIIVASGPQYRMQLHVIVTPEYNHGAAPALINALNYVLMVWNHKPAGFVSYGRLSGGTRSVAMTNTILVDGVFTAAPPQDAATVTMLDELARWADAPKALRA